MIAAMAAECRSTSMKARETTVAADAVADATQDAVVVEMVAAEEAAVALITGETRIRWMMRNRYM